MDAKLLAILVCPVTKGPLIYKKEQNELIYLVVDAVDRIQRSFKETVLLTDMMKQKQVELHFLKENLVLNEESNPMQVMMWNFAVMCAENFILSSGYNIKRSNQRKLNKGELLKTNIPKKRMN